LLIFVVSVCCAFCVFFGGVGMEVDITEVAKGGFGPCHVFGMACAEGRKPAIYLAAAVFLDYHARFQTVLPEMSAKLGEVADSGNGEPGL